jgi:hypothetical protein
MWIWDTRRVSVFEVTFADGSRQLVEADYHERIRETEHFVRQTGGSGEERWTEIDADRIASIIEVTI